MTNNLYDTQKIRLDLQAELNKAEQELENRPTLEKVYAVRWLESKIAFYRSGKHKEYDKQNGTRVPDEGLLE